MTIGKDLENVIKKTGIYSTKVNFKLINIMAKENTIIKMEMFMREIL